MDRQEKMEKIIKRCYRDITSSFGTYDSEELTAQLLPPGYEDYQVWRVYQTRYANEPGSFADEGYGELYHIISLLNDDEFLGLVVGNELCDVTDDVIRIGRGYFYDDEWDDEDWSPEAMIRYGKELYDAYGPDVDTYDLDEYDAECYLAYKSTL